MPVVVALQEIPRWLPSVAAKTKFILLTDDKSDCGLLFPKSWSKLIRSVSISKYMCAATLGPYLFASLHLLWDRPPEGCSQGSGYGVAHRTLCASGRRV